MGCNNCIRKEEDKSEMKEGQLPVKNTDNFNDELRDEVPISEQVKSPEIQISNLDSNTMRKHNNDNNYTEKTSEPSELNAVNQERSEQLFDYLNDVRMHPEKFSKEIEENNLVTLFDNFVKSNKKPNTLIKNGFFNLLLDSYIKKNTGNDGTEGELYNLIEKDSQLLSFSKKLYIVHAPVSKVEDAVWNLLKNKENTALSGILKKNLDYLVISTIPVKNSLEFKAYFLFLVRKKN